jgi:hypothetical protein
MFDTKEKYFIAENLPKIYLGDKEEIYLGSQK